MSIDLSTRYLGMALKHPIVASASPLTGSIDSLKRLDDAGVAAVVLPSLFEEQIEHDEMSTHNLMLYGAELSPEARGFFPEQQHYDTGPDRYLTLIADAQKSLSVPVIASLNGYTAGGWTGIAKQLEQAGADAIELNVYFLATRLDDTSATVEARYVDLVQSVADQVKMPVAVKVAPFFSAMANMASRLAQVGRRGPGAVQPVPAARHRTRRTAGGAEPRAVRRRTNCAWRCAGSRSCAAVSRPALRPPAAPTPPMT